MKSGCGVGLYAGIGTKLLQSVLTASFLFVAQRRVFELVKRVSRSGLSGKISAGLMGGMGGIAIDSQAGNVVEGYCLSVRYRPCVYDCIDY